MIDATFVMKLKSRESWYSLFRNNGLLFSRQSTDSSQYNYPIYSEYVTKKSQRVICKGCFEIPSLLEHIKPILIKEFTPKFPPMENNVGLYDVINKSNSVCVSVRRGDFVDERHRSSFFVCDKKYFESAIHLAKELVRDPVFIFFSDDIDWVKKNISVEAPSFYESGNDPVWEKLRLMYNCKHFIISNSTFSWWAQYLSRNTKDKVVISPDHWFNVYTGFPSPLIADYFVKIPCEYHRFLQKLSIRNGGRTSSYSCYMQLSPVCLRAPSKHLCTGAQMMYRINVVVARWKQRLKWLLVPTNGM